MKNLFVFVLTLCICLNTLDAQQIQYTKPVLNPESCTSIMVGKRASADGSVMTSHTCDSNYRTWMDIIAASKTEKDTTVNVYTGRMHTNYNEGMRGVVLKGSIPQAHETYQFLNTAYPCLNEKQLAMGETTISGREELVNEKGLFNIEELQRIALQRCSTARDAIRLMGELIEKYGYGDWGECLTIADTKEVWHFEVFGEGQDKVGGVWAAVRIPDDHVGVSANISRISKLDLKDKDHYMASKNVYSAAKRLGLWDGKMPFRFWEVYSGTNYFDEVKSFSIREFYILNKLAPSLHLSYDAEELPISVKPDKKVSAQDVMALLAETYEGSEYDVIKNLKVEHKNRKTNEVDTITSPVANPWMTRDMATLLNTLKPGVVDRNRLVAVPQCAYSTVIQLRDWLPDAVGGVVWMALDNPGQSPRFPIFCGTKDLPASFKICGQYRFDEDAAVWYYRRANKLATVRWGVTKDQIQSGMSHFVDKGQMELPYVEKRYQELVKTQGEDAAKAFLTNYTADFAGATMLRWKEMGDSFWARFARGF